MNLSDLPGLTAPQALTTHRVICVSHGFQTNYERGFCNALAAHRVQVTLIGSDASDRPGLLPGVTLLNLRGSQDTARPRLLKLLNLLRYHLRLLMYTAGQRQAIVHTMGSLDPALLCGVLEGLWFRCWTRRVVLTVHDLLPHDKHTRFNRLMHRWSYQLPHMLVVHTERMKRDLASRFGVDPARIVVMQHGIEPMPGHAAPADEELRDPSAVPTILMFGRIAPYKGLDLLLEALREVSFDYRLVIAGACPSADYRRQLQQLLATHPQGSHITWHDRFIDEAEMAPLFKAADVVAMPYRHIDQSGVVFQALRFGVPLLATRVGSLDDFVRPEVGELARPCDVPDLRAALERWAARRHSLSRADIRALGRAYAWPATVTALRHAYAI